MNSIVYHFVRVLLSNMRLYLKSDGIDTGPVFWMRLAKLLFVSPGYMRLSFGPFIRYYMPGFDPRNVDDSDLIARGRTWLAENLPDRSADMAVSGGGEAAR